MWVGWGLGFYKGEREIVTLEKARIRFDITLYKWLLCVEARGRKKKFVTLKKVTVLHKTHYPLGPTGTSEKLVNYKERRKRRGNLNDF